MKRVGFIIAITVLLGWGSALALFDLLNQVSAISADAHMRFVAPDGNDANNCNSAGTRCQTIQRAVDVADAGDVIKISEGIYTDTHGRPSAPFYNGSIVVTQVVYISKSVTIRGGYSSINDFAEPPASVSVLEPSGKSRGIYIAPGTKVALAGLHIVGGNASGLGGGGAPSYSDAGGGLYADRSETQITDCQFVDNRASSAGGIYVNGGVFVLQNSVITANVASTATGGGIQLYNPMIADISNNRILSNTSGTNGGGLYLAYGFSDTVVSNNLISQNRSGAGGGGIYMNSAATIASNHLSGNVAGRGGAIYINSRSPVIWHNQILDNDATIYGGGAYLSGDTSQFSANIIISNSAARDGGGLLLSRSGATLENNVVAQNQVGDNESGAGIFVWGGSPLLVHTTVAQNHGGDGSGLFLTDNSGMAGTMALTNTILVSQEVGLFAQGGNTATLNGILWYGNLLSNTGGSGNITVSHEIVGDPGFINASSGDYHIDGQSAAIDSGVNSDQQFDIDGQPRLGVPDIGADERVSILYLPVLLTVPP